MACVFTGRVRLTYKGCLAFILRSKGEFLSEGAKLHFLLVRNKRLRLLWGIGVVVIEMELAVFFMKALEAFPVSLLLLHGSSNNYKQTKRCKHRTVCLSPSLFFIIEWETHFWGENRMLRRKGK